MPPSPPPAATAERPAPRPERFQTARSTLLLDRFMSSFIKVGGLSIILAVLAIFVFIFWQVLPLFQKAEVRELGAYPAPAGDYAVLGADEWGAMPFLADARGRVVFMELSAGGEARVKDSGLPPNAAITAVSFNTRNSQLVYGTQDGRFSIVELRYEPVFEEGARRVQAELEPGPLYEIGRRGFPVRAIAYGESGSDKLAAAIQDTGRGRLEVHAAGLVQERTLLGAGEITVGGRYDFTAHIAGTPFRLLVNKTADGVMVATKEGRVYYFFREGGAPFELRQSWTPFGGTEDESLSSMDFVFGDVSLVFTNSKGRNRVFSLFRPEGSGTRLFGQIKEFPDLPQGASFFDFSLRNKAFLIGHGSKASIRYSTTESVRWEAALPFSARLAALGRRYDRMFFLDSENNLRVLGLRDPHPEAGAKAFLGKVWYEGADAPRHEWQSTGGSDDFEIKLSLVPLIVGTLKGTLYAMLFALPIALLAALYTAMFAHPRFRRFVKPVMEIMASLPSVVLGFLAALWLAPLIETRIPSVLAAAVLLPLTALAFGWGWESLPVRWRKLVAPGSEWIVLMPVMLLALGASLALGPALERLFFAVTDAQGARVADFRLWWPHATGTPFEQRNALVVGFMMGFAVIPIIFTITEDSLSNVPASLVSGSLALGASRWQTALRVVVPTAAAGIFSACMIGLGRAVGETMIVVMATGNTPIMDFNIFSGMRTLSANIAVELPEAPHHGTLYRSLFLGAMVLFMMTFVVNTLAEILRQHLREKYKTV